MPDETNRNEPNEPLAALVAELRAHLTWAGDAGLRSGGEPPVARKPAPVAAAAPVAKPVATPMIAVPTISSAQPPEIPMARAPAKPAPAAAALTQVPGTPLARSKVALPTLESVRAELGECTRCKLHKGRHSIVFGAGSPTARLVFVGEAPGEDEDLQGIPFVGRAGQLLTKMIEAMGLTRDEVYICNTVKCRPPNNRNPEPDELGACEPFLKGQLAALRPEAIVTLGKFASQALLRDETPISRLRGAWREYNGVPLMPTFHPSYLLRSPGEKGKVWSDLQQVMAKLGLKPRAGRRVARARRAQVVGMPTIVGAASFSTCSAAILAGGQGKRFGGDKPLAPVPRDHAARLSPRGDEQAWLWRRRSSRRRIQPGCARRT